MPTSIKEKEEQIKVLEAEYQKKSKALEDHARIREAHIQEVEKSIEHYGSRLGLCFSRAQNCLRFMFTLIDSANPDREFSFNLRVDAATNSYELLQCEPALEKSANLLEQLNEDNNLSRFVCLMRKEFKNTYN
eukprot:TRINITY_DN19126_c0_g1_i2.p1 TRINITY_DN19126_c0_g1~~TRINITY_DN19126_c0_g1_i2.p1  ORF type:complete len:133 (+),score=40.57 TRINITY_DN19126_c0_g1_i2:299-697(+)